MVVVWMVTVSVNRKIQLVKIAGFNATLAALLALAGCGGSNREQTAAVVVPGRAAASVPAENTEQSQQSVEKDNRVTVSGPLIVEHQVEVTAQRDGTLIKVTTEAGARVKAGALLGQLDDRQIIANLEAGRAKSRSVENDLKNWQAEVEVVKADLVRAQRLWDEGLIPQDQLQHAKFKVESEQWDIKRVTELLNTSRQEERSLELELEKTRITAPFDCLVARRYVREGQSVTRGEKVFWVTAESPLLLRFTLPEKYLGHVKVGQQLELSSPDTPGEKHVAKIKEVGSVIDPSSGTFDVLAEIPGARGALRPGMTATARLAIPQ
jgi:membrane fusion protein (multidrug efflux system)